MRAERLRQAVAYERMLKEVATALRRSLAPRLVRVGLCAHEGEDLVQEILIGLHGKRHTWDPARPFLPWLHTMTRYKLIDFMRHRRRDTRRRVDLPLEDWVEMVDLPADEAMHWALEMIAILRYCRQPTQDRPRDRGRRRIRPQCRPGACDQRGRGPGDAAPRDQPTSGGCGSYSGGRTAPEDGHESTDDLIRALASAAGTRRERFLQAALAVTGAASLACALLLVFSVFGIRQDFADMAVRMPFAFKVVYTGALVFGASVVALYAATPGASATALYALSPAVILLACGVIFDPTDVLNHGEDQHCLCHLRGPHSFSAASHDPDLRLHAESRADATPLRGSSHWNAFCVCWGPGLHARLQE